MTPEYAPIPDVRPLTDAERTLARWMLAHGAPEADAYLGQLDRAHVVARCPCGCASIDLAVDGEPAPTGPLHVLGDYVFGGPTDLAGAFVFARAGVLAGLEVYGLAGDAPSALPLPADLRPFGDNRTDPTWPG